MKTYSIVGQKFLGLDPYLTGTLPGTPVMLVRDPTNAFDPNAIAVYIDNARVGYIPKKDNAALAAFIDANGMDFNVQPMALDEVEKPRRGIPAKFVRSPNSAYPQVEVAEVL
jgi:hypothetical protein